MHLNQNAKLATIKIKKLKKVIIFSKYINFKDILFKKNINKLFLYLANNYNIFLKKIK